MRNPGRSLILLFIAAFIITQVLITIKPFGVDAIKSIAPDVNILELQFTYTPEDAHKTFIKLGEHGRNAYITFLLVDIFFIVAYTGLFTIIISAIVNYFKYRTRLPKFLWLLPLSSGVFDLFENVFIYLQLKNFPNENIVIYETINILTKIKGFTVILSETIILIGFIAFLVSKFISKGYRKSRTDTLVDSKQD